MFTLYFLYVKYVQTNRTKSYHLLYVHGITMKIALLSELIVNYC